LINRLKTVLKAATAAGENQYLHYTDSSFKVISEGVDEIYLNEIELKALQELDLPAELQKTRDSFILLCWTGVRVSDFPQLNAGNVYNGSFQIQQTKTKGRVNIPIFPEADEILSKYNYKMPTEADQVFNRKLKQLGQKMNESEDPRLGKKDFSQLKTKCGRRSLATNLVLRGKPAKAIMSMTGHTTEKSFWTYVKLEPGSFKEILMQKDE
jgi:integrase